MSVRIMARKAYEFSTNEAPPDTLRIKVEPFVVATVPEWVLEHELFLLAEKSGNVEIMGNTVTGLSIAEIEELQDKAKAYCIKNYKNMKPDLLKSKIAEVESAQNNKNQPAQANGQNSLDTPE